MAHPCRAYKLAQLLARDGHSVVFGTPEKFHSMFQPEAGIEKISIQSVQTADFLQRIDREKFPYTLKELRVQLVENLKLLRKYRPRAVVGDVRYTLPIASFMEWVPCITLADFHWSPLCQTKFPVPDSVNTRRFGARLSKLVGPWILRLVLSLVFRPLNQIRKENGFPGYPDIRRAYCDGDATFYVGFEHAATQQLEQNQFFGGPLLWQGGSWGAFEVPQVNNETPVALLSLGSSGNYSCFNTIVEGLLESGVRVIASHPNPEKIPRDFLSRGLSAYKFLDFGKVLTKVDFMVGNGGSSTIWGALCAGKPYLGVYSLLDQAFCIEWFARGGGVLGLSSLELKKESVAAAARNLLQDRSYTDCARAYQDKFEQLGGDAFTVLQFNRVLKTLEEKNHESKSAGYRGMRLRRSPLSRAFA